MKFAFYLTLLTLLAYSCKSDANHTTTHVDNDVAIEEDSSFINLYFDSVFLPELSDIFRGVNFDETIDEVKASEAEQNFILTEDEDGYLQYEKDLFVDTAKGIDYSTIKYIFDSYDRLWVITLNYIIQDSAKTEELFDHLHTTFNEEYGDYYLDREGFTFWEGTYMRPDSTEVVYDLGVRKLLKFADPGIQIELMRFGQL